jgi:amino acid adenylation domain-containing protein
MDLAQRLSKLSPEQRKLFELKMQQQNVDILTLPITKENRNNDNEQQRFPLSFGQERLWFIHQLDPENTAYNIIKAIKLEGSLEKHALEQSIQEIIRRHEILRTIFVTEKQGPAQVILKQLSLPLEIIDLKDVPKEKQESEVKDIIRDESRHVFDLNKGPLLKTKLMVLNEKQDKHVFLLVIHHIISDGTSLQVFIKELVQLYGVFSQKKPSHLPGLPIQYADYASWQRRIFGENTISSGKTGLKQKQETYWLNQFRGHIPVLTLSSDYPRPVMQEFEGITIDFILDIPETKALKQMALRNKTTLYVVLLAIYNIFLSKLSSQEDIVVGTPVAGRRHPDVQKLIGMFVNTLALRNYPDQYKTFQDFLQEVRNRTLNAFENQEYRYEDIIGKVDVTRDTSRNPLFDVMFLLKDMDQTDVTGTGLMLKHYKIENKTSKFDLTLSAWDEKPGPITGKQEELHFSFEYCTRLFKDTTIQRFIDYFKQVVSSVVKDPGIKLADLEIMPGDEKQKILYDFNDTGTQYPNDKTLQQLFAEQVERTPDQIALIGQSVNTFVEAGLQAKNQELRFITYKELNKKSNQLASVLKTMGVNRETIVGIFVDRSPELLTAIFAVLKAGAIYLPLDPHHPLKRIKYMLKESDTGIVLINNHNRALPGDEFVPVDINGEKNDIHDTSNPETVTSSQEPAYVIYTSGTTGIPKGVIIEHRSMVNFIKGMTEIIDFNLRDRILSLTTVSFDIFSLETIVPLTQGSAVVIGSSDEQIDPGAALQVIDREKVTIFQLTPSRLQLLLSYREAKAAKILALLRYLLVGGEAFPQGLLEQVKSVTGVYKRKIYNVYGPTETTVWSTSKDLSGETLLNIGKPIANTQVYILAKSLKPAAIGVLGDIYIGGAGVARGYLNNPELTADKFIFNPYQLNRSNMSYKSYILYCTGDLGRWLPDGNIDFLGRIDHQVKIRGFRIELEEIENRLMRHEAISEAVVIAKESENKDKYLCAYYVPNKRNNVNQNQEIPVSELREFLSVELPDYMIPSYFVPLELMPLTPNRKIDKKALSKLDDIQSQVGTAFLAPQTDMEKTISQCWMEVLNRDKVGIHDNFFELGGNSMNIIQLNTELKRTLDKDIPVVALYKHLTISSFARYLREEESNALLYGKESKQNQQVESLHRAKNLFKNTIKKTIGAKNAGEK